MCVYHLCVFKWNSSIYFCDESQVCLLVNNARVSLIAPINYVPMTTEWKKMTTTKKNCLHALMHTHIHTKTTNALLHCLLYWKMNEMWFCWQFTKESENTDNCVKASFYCTHTSALHRYKCYMSNVCDEVDVEISEGAVAKNQQGVHTEASISNG